MKRQKRGQKRKRDELSGLVAACRKTVASAFPVKIHRLHPCTAMRFVPLVALSCWSTPIVHVFLDAVRQASLILFNRPVRDPRSSCVSAGLRRRLGAA